MTKHIPYLLVLLVLMCTQCSSGNKITSDNSLGLAHTITSSIKQIGIDNLENIYVLTEENDINRYDNKNTIQYKYNNSLDGEISTIDVTNPQKILCFIRPFNRLIQLDNTLAKTNTIELNDTEFLNVSAAARSNDNNIWIFDNTEQTLNKINDAANPIFKSNRLSDYGLENIDPILIKEKANKVVMLDENLGLIIFDNFGQYLKTIAVNGVTDFQMWGEGILYVKKGKLLQYSPTLLESTEVMGIPLGYETTKISKSNYYHISKSGLLIEARNTN